MVWCSDGNLVAGGGAGFALGPTVAIPLPPDRACSRGPKQLELLYDEAAIHPASRAEAISFFAALGHGRLVMVGWSWSALSQHLLRTQSGRVNLRPTMQYSIVFGVV